MEQTEFFKLIERKKIKEALITFDCECQLIYSPITKEIFGKPCTNKNHAQVMD